MSRPPRSHALVTGEPVFRLDDAAWSFPGQQVAQGFEDQEAIRDDGTEFADDLNTGNQFLVIWFSEIRNY